MNTYNILRISLFLFLITNTIFGQIDTTPPELLGISSTYTDYFAGDTIVLTVNTSDNESDISFIQIEIVNSIGTQRHIVYGTIDNDGVVEPTEWVNEGSSNYRNSFEFNEYAMDGIWYVEKVLISDTSDNDLSESYTEFNSPFSFTAGSNNQDTINPDFKGLTLNKSSFSRGESIEFTIETLDNLSGIDTIQIDIVNADGEQRQSIFGSLGFWDAIDTNTYVQSLELDTATIPGEWYVANIYIIDLGLNQLAIEYEATSSPYTFTVVGNEEDTTPPELLGISSTYANYFAGEKIELTVNTSDASSGIAFIQIEMVNSIGTQRHTVYGTIDDDGVVEPTEWIDLSNNRYRNSFEFNAYAMDGIWYVEKVLISDTSDNDLSNTYTEFNSPFTFSAGSNNQDTINPVFSGLTLDKNNYLPGESIEFTIEASDNLAGIDTIQIDIVNADGEQRQHIFGSIGFWNTVNTDTYVQSLELDKAAIPGEWYVANIYIIDLGLNRLELEYDANSSPYKFRVQEEGVDITAPVFVGITSNDTNYTAGDEITFTLEAFDNLDEISSMQITITNSVGEQLHSIYTWQQLQDNKFRGFLTLNEYAMDGIWYVSSVFINDLDNNEFFKEYLKTNSPHTFSVNNSTQDTTAPMLTSVTSDKSTYVIRGEIEITVEATDDFSGVQFIQVFLVNENGGEMQSITGEINTDEWKSIGNNKYQFNTYINDNALLGEWYVAEVSIGDEGLNIFRETYVIDNSPYNFTVINKDLSVENFRPNSSKLMISSHNDILKIMADSLIEDIVVFDMYGKPIALNKIEKTSFSFNYPNAIYFAKIKIEGKWMTQKFINQ